MTTHTRTHVTLWDDRGLMEARFDTFSPEQHRQRWVECDDLDLQLERTADYVRSLETDLKDPHLDETGRLSKEATLSVFRPRLQELLARKRRADQANKTMAAE